MYLSVIANVLPQCSHLDKGLYLEGASDAAAVIVCLGGVLHLICVVDYLCQGGYVFFGAPLWQVKHFCTTYMHPHKHAVRHALCLKTSKEFI